MTYSNFIDSLSNGANLFYTSLVQVANSLIHNYIFITMLGLTIFCSLLYFVVYAIRLPYFSKQKDLDNVK